MINPNIQKVPKQIKDKLNGFRSLFETKLRLINYQRTIDQQRIIRILTGIQISHLLLSITDISKKSEILPLEELRIGFIGCGVIGRMLVNDIIPLAKNGLKLQNVAISTRQVENVQMFERFGIQVQFNNEKVVQNSHVIIISTPASLDNWILIQISKTIKEKQKKYKEKSSISISKNKSPLIIILTSGINEKIVRSHFGLQSLVILPYQTFEGMSDLYSSTEELWEVPNERLNQFVIQQKSFQLFEKNSESLIQILGAFFEINSSIIENKNLGIVREHLEAPRLIDNYIEKYRRFKQYVQSL